MIGRHTIPVFFPFYHKRFGKRIKTNMLACGSEFSRCCHDAITIIQNQFRQLYLMATYKVLCQTSTVKTQTQFLASSSWNYWCYMWTIKKISTIFGQHGLEVIWPKFGEDSINAAEDRFKKWVCNIINIHIIYGYTRWPIGKKSEFPMRNYDFVVAFMTNS